MGTPTWTPLATTTLGSSASSVTFSNIPNTYRDLILVINGTQAAAQVVYARFNGDSGSNYSGVGMRGNGTNTASYTTPTNYIPVWYAGDPTSGNAIVQIMDSSATDKHKTVLVRGNTNSNATEATAARWANTNAITSLSVFSNGSTFSIGFTASLYGVIA